MQAKNTRRSLRSSGYSRLLATTALAAAAFSSLSVGGAGQAFADGNFYDPDIGTIGGSVVIPYGINSDGSVIVGASFTAQDMYRHAFRWTSSGMEDLGTYVGPNNQSTAYGVSGDGLVVVGTTDTSTYVHAFRWTAGNGMEDLSVLAGGDSSEAKATNSDGSVVVGYSESTGGRRAFRWTAADQMVDLGTFDNTSTWSEANGVSADGSVVVGFSKTAGNAAQHAFRWTAADQMVDLSTLSGDTTSNAQGVSADGTTVVGYSNGSSSQHAFRWTVGGGMQDLGSLGGAYAQAIATNADGSVVVGSGYITGNAAQRGFRWTNATGMISVEDWLRNNGVTVATDFTKEAKAVSADGSIVVGRTTNDKAFIARVVPAPPPSGGNNPGNGGGNNPGNGSGSNPGNGAGNNPGNGNSNGENPGGGSGIIDVEQYTQTLAGKPTVQIGLDYAGTALNGAHGEPMRNLLDAGRQSFSVTADTGYDKSDASNGGLGIGDIGYGIGLEGGATARFALGGLYTKQDLDAGGDFKQKGVYVAPEVTLPIGSGLYATVGGYYAAGKLDIDREYLNGGLPDTSRGETDVDTWAAKLRVDWLNAATIQDTNLTPYASITYAHSQMDGYTEEGGSFPSQFDSTSDHSTVARLGLDSVTDITSHIRLLGKAEAAYRFEKQTADVTGTIVGLSAFDLDGHDIDQFWVRGAIGAEFDAGGGTASLSINASTEGDDPSVWLKSGWRVTF